MLQMPSRLMVDIQPIGRGADDGLEGIVLEAVLVGDGFVEHWRSP